MQFLRRRLSFLVAAWLACQAATAFIAPVSLMAGASLALCTCPDGTPGQVCPMHRGHHDQTSDQSRCVIRSTAANPDATLLSLLSNIGVMPASDGIALEAPAAVVQPQRVLPPLTQSDIPDLPPPRA